MKPLYFVIDGIKILTVCQDKNVAKFLAKKHAEDNLTPPDDVKIYSINCGEVEYV